MSETHSLTVVTNVMKGPADIHVHAAGCRDLKTDRALRTGVQDTDEYGSLAEVVTATYPPSDFEYDADSDDEINAYLSGFHFAPCVPELPFREDGVSSNKTTTATTTKETTAMTEKTATKKPAAKKAAAPKPAMRDRVKREPKKLTGKAAPLPAEESELAKPKAKTAKAKVTKEPVQRGVKRENPEYEQHRKEVVELREKHALKWAEIAERMGRHENYVRQRYLEAKAGPAQEATPEAVLAARDVDKLGWADMEVRFRPLTRGQIKKIYVEAGGDLVNSYVGRGGRIHPEANLDLRPKAEPKPKRERKPKAAADAEAPVAKAVAKKAAPKGRSKKLTLANDATIEQVREAIEGKTITLAETGETIEVKQVTKLGKKRGTEDTGAAIVDAATGKQRVILLAHIASAR